MGDFLSESAMIDSMSGEQSESVRVLSNPELSCPPEILKLQVLLTVLHYGFDGQRHSGIIEVHKALADDVDAFFKFASDSNFPIEHVVQAGDPAYLWNDDKLMAANASSGFNYRLIAGTTNTSLHGQGLAFDINPRQNPYMRYSESKVIVAPEGASWNPDVPGTLSAKHPLVRFMLERGWEWGGSWNQDSGRVDYQHLQKQIESV